jgi:predicted dienelactone hydrolase
MRIFEILMGIINFLALLQCLYLAWNKSSWARLFFPAGIALVLLLHTWIEKARWQMTPVYVVSGCMILWASAQLVFHQQRVNAHRLLILQGFTRFLFIPLSFLLLGLGTLLSVLAPVFQIPAPSGQASIGTLDIHLVDSARPELFTDNLDDSRELMVRVWYPADPSPADVSQPYWPEVKHTGPLILEQLGLPTFLLDYMVLVPSHSYLDAPISNDSPKYPVLVFSHGYFDDFSGELTLMEELASHGYIVFSISHPYEAMAVEFPGGRIVLADPRVFTIMYQDLPSGIDMDYQVDVWVKDTLFVLDQLEELNADLDGNILAGHLDLGKIGVFGYSFGGATATEVCLLDDRCLAGANLDGSQFGYADFESNHLKTPFLFFYNEWSEGMNDYIYSSVENWAYRVTIDGTKHLNFADKVLWSPYLAYVDEILPYGLGPIDARRMIEIKRAYLLAFFDRHIKGKFTPLLDGPSASYPEVHYQFHLPPQ